MFSLGTTPSIGRPKCFSISSGFLIFVSIYSNKNTTKSPIISPNTVAIATFITLLGLTGDCGNTALSITSTPFALVILLASSVNILV